ncbi:NAD(P)-binding protein [Dichomitus squalens]|uniref:NAD(P)-binding protein n=1 Tax=Dichomitus squalens TaxID=114155 RepID=A0A4Q9M9E6_9APHY|nr:NAD(P)-binding protein [Dichomitus squalens]
MREPSASVHGDMLPDLMGKVMIVTGGNSGIGYATVQQLARRGAKVYIAGRSQERVSAAIARLHEEGLEPGNGKLEWLELDLEAPSKIKDVAAAFLEKEGRLDVLVHNAGRMRTPYVLGEGGIEKSMLVNYVGPFLLTKALLPLMTKTAKEKNGDVRIVTLSSSEIRQLKGYEVRYRNLDDWNKEYAGEKFPIVGAKKDDQLRYSKTKLAITLYTQELQRRLDTDGVPITVMSVHPGWVYTEGFLKDPLHDIPILGWLLNFIFKLTFKTPTEGAQAPVFAAASPDVAERRDRFKGAYLVSPGKIATPQHPQAESVVLAEELWKATEPIVRQWEG